MDVYWLEQAQADVPAENDWLSAAELARLNGLRFARRRADWRLGRWTAKRALAACLNRNVRGVEDERSAGWPELTSIEIGRALSGAPEVFFANKPTSVSISLSHRAGIAVCAVAPTGGALGCDLETIEPRSDAFVSDYFTTREQALVARASASDRFRLVALLWSAKESALKALHEGLRLDTRSVGVSPGDALGCRGEDRCLEDPAAEVLPPYALNGWRPLHVHHTDAWTFRGWWQQRGSILRTMVAAPPPVPPILLRVPNYCSREN